MKKLVVLTNKETKVKTELTEKEWANHKAKYNLTDEFISRKYEVRNVIWNTYMFEAWVHPKNNGDDRLVDLGISAETEQEANKLMEEWLKKRSAITTDYKLISINNKKLKGVKTFEKQFAEVLA
jgi:hypothetical protein